jgi:transcriptional regulator with XRE-family HTH domain
MKQAQSGTGKAPIDKRRKSAPPKELAVVGARIRAARKERGISQDKLAYAIPLDRAHIGMIENGKRAATIPTLVKIAVALDCEVGELFPPISELRAAS